jgi:hypothetical protein
VPAFFASANAGAHLPCFLIPFRWKDWTRAGHFCYADGIRRITMTKTVVVNEEEFETLVEAIQDEDGWTVDESTIRNLDGTVAAQTSDTSPQAQASEKGKGMAAWLIGTALVAIGVLAVFILFAPRFIDAFNTQITAMIP